MPLKVKNITIINLQGSVRYAVGDKVEGNEIASITDASIEYEDSYASVITMNDKNGVLLKRIENCPVDITYLID